MTSFVDPASADPGLLPPARRRLFATLGLLVVLVTFGSPSGVLIDIPISLLIKNKLGLSASDAATFRALAAIPLFASAVFGFTRDVWSPFGHGDRGFLLLFGGLTVALYLGAAVLPMTYPTLLATLLLLRMSFQLVASAQSGLISTIGRQQAMSGQISTVWRIVEYTVVISALLLGGTLSELLEPQPGDEAFHTLFLIGAAIVVCVVLYAAWRPPIVFDSVRSERSEAAAQPLNDLKRLARHRPVYPALLIILMWNFAPGAETSLLFFLQNKFGATDAQWGEYSAIFGVSFIPAFLAFGALCRKVPLRQLLLWGTVVAVPQYVPLLFIHSLRGALLAAVPIGLMGGMATAAYLDLVIRSCPRGLGGTTLMMATALQIVSERLGDVLGAHLYNNYGGFTVCVAAITATYLLIIPVLFLIPSELVGTADGEANDFDAAARSG